jgi:F-type H+-transporting ATPase subunit alpha
VGGNAQIKAMKQVAGPLRLSLAQYRELAAFAQFGSDLDAVTQRQLARGARLVELLKQPQYAPVPVEQQVAGIFAVSNGLADDVPVEQIRKWEKGMLAYLQTKGADLLDEIRTKKAMNDDLNARLKGAIEKFKPTFIPG